jgi:hypothetical protein
VLLPLGALAVVYLKPLTTCIALLTLKNELLVWWYVLLYFIQ